MLRDVGVLGWYHELTPRPLVDEGFFVGLLLWMGTLGQSRYVAGWPGQEGQSG